MKAPKTKAAKKLGVPTLERVDNTLYRLELEKAVLPLVSSIKIKISTTSNVTEPLKEYKRALELKSVRKVNKI